AWLANPYYGLPKEVDAANWATLKLLSPANTHVPRPVPAITLTPPVTIPGEYFYYAVDQHPLTSDISPGGNDKQPLDHDKVPVQIHRWLGSTSVGDAGERQVGDWVIAERLLVRRGELIGRRLKPGPKDKDKTDVNVVLVEVPEWDASAGGF